MKKSIKRSVEIICIAFSFGVGAVIIMYLLSVLISSADGAEIELTQPPPSFEEFQKWFGPHARLNSRNDQLFKATKLLLEEMEKPSAERDLAGAIASNRCGIVPNEWQDVLSVAFSYRTWQEICILRGEVSKLQLGVSKTDFLTEIARLENSLKAEFQKILDGQTDIKAKLDALQKSVDSFAQKLGPQIEELLARVKDQLTLLDDISARTQRIEEVVNDNHDILIGIDGKVDQLLVPKVEPEPEIEHVCLVPKPAWKEPPKNFWAGVGALGGEKVYTNPLGVMADFAVFHTRPGLFFYFEAGARKFLIKDFLGVQLFGGYGSAWFAGVGAVGFIQPLDISVSAGAQFFPDYLVGELGPVQVYAELTHEGRWTRMSLRVVPSLQLATLGVDTKF